MNKELFIAKQVKDGVEAVDIVDEDNVNWLIAHCDFERVDNDLQFSIDDVLTNIVNYYL